jgi:hypothetical protein
MVDRNRVFRSSIFPTVRLFQRPVCATGRPAVSDRSAREAPPLWLGSSFNVLSPSPVFFLAAQFQQPIILGPSGFSVGKRVEICHDRGAASRASRAMRGAFGAPGPRAALAA